MHVFADSSHYSFVVFGNLAVYFKILCDVCYFCEIETFSCFHVVFAFLHFFSCKHNPFSPLSKHFSTYLYIVVP